MAPDILLMFLLEGLMGVLQLEMARSSKNSAWIGRKESFGMNGLSLELNAFRRVCQ